MAADEAAHGDLAHWRRCRWRVRSASSDQLMATLCASDEASPIAAAVNLKRDSATDVHVYCYAFAARAVHDHVRAVADVLSLDVDLSLDAV